MAKHYVHKAHGVPEVFSKEKLLESLRRARISENIRNEVADSVTETLPDETNTAQIRDKIKKELASKTRGGLARYSLKEAIMNLGPSGFPFEQYVAYLWAEQGYITKVDQIFNGVCITHEVDVTAEKDGEILLMECKYHNKRGIKSDVKVALYVAARFADIREAWKDNTKAFNQAWLVTNTKLTSDARDYANCYGLQVMSWNHPVEGSLRDMITDRCLYPITALSSLRHVEVEELMKRRVVVCKQLLDGDESKLVGLDKSRIQEAIEEAKLVCDDSL